MWIIVLRHVWRCRFRGSLRDEGLVVAPRRRLSGRSATEINRRGRRGDARRVRRASLCDGLWQLLRNSLCSFVH
jgi:hypothetical protein